MFALGLIIGSIATAYVGSLYLVWVGEESWRRSHRGFWRWIWNGE